MPIKSVEILVANRPCLHGGHRINTQDQVLRFLKSCTFYFLSANPIQLRRFYKNASNSELCGKC